mgnify:FL=1
MTAVPVRDRHANGGQGMNWIRKEKRLAIYLRDGLACVYCGEAVEDGAKLTLDHLHPHSEGGDNHEMNLATACHRCNSARGNRTVAEFAEAVAQYLNHDVTPRAIPDHIKTTIQRPLDLAAAKALIARRGGFTQSLRKD